MGSAPIGAALFVPADQDAKVDAGFTVALLAKLMEADDLRSTLFCAWAGVATSAVVAEIPTAITVAAIKGF